MEDLKEIIRDPTKTPTDETVDIIRAMKQAILSEPRGSVAASQLEDLITEIKSSQLSLEEAKKRAGKICDDVRTSEGSSEIFS